MIMILSLALVAFFKPYKKTLNSLNYIEAASVGAILFSTLLTLIENSRATATTNSADADMQCAWKDIQGETIGIMFINAAVFGLCMLSMSGFFNRKKYDKVNSRWNKVRWATRAFKGIRSNSAEPAASNGQQREIQMVEFPGTLLPASRGSVSSIESSSDAPQNSDLWQQLCLHASSLMRLSIDVEQLAENANDPTQQVQNLWAALRNESGAIEDLKMTRDLVNELLAAGAELEGDDEDHEDYIKHVSGTYHFHQLGPSRHSKGQSFKGPLGPAPGFADQNAEEAEDEEAGAGQVPPRNFYSLETEDGEHYYVDALTKETVWDLPDWGILVDQGVTLPDDVPPLSPDCKPLVMERHFYIAEAADGEVYYVDADTEETVWDLPEGAIVVDDEEEGSVGSVSKSDSDDGELPSDFPSQIYYAADSGDGETYYVDSVTKETVWELPEGAVLQ
jgi:hypothetical protein